jgi:hypothetical protein
MPHRDLFLRTASRTRVRRARPHVELLETRNLLSAYPLTPAEIRHAYGFDQVSNTGAGQKIAIIDAYNDPNIFKDADTFDKAFGWSTSSSTSLYTQFGASTQWLTKTTPQGSPRGNSGWSEEISLDVEWAHAIAPAATIMLVEAKSNSFTNLLGAVDYATNQGATVVSMSWGSGEFSGETSYDSHFPASNGVTYVASAGDTGSVVEWPAVSPNVVGVGGTSLSVDTSGNYLGETAWSGSGGGVSAYESKPSYQSSVTQSATQRSSPDVAYNADPNTGVAVYDSYGFGGGWGQYGGTSVGAPQWAGLFALANQSRTTNLSSSGALAALYSNPTAFNDVTSGSSGTFSAGPGFDLVTGLGTPQVANLKTALQAASGTAATQRISGSSSTSTRNGAGHSIPVSTTPNVIVVVPLATPVPVHVPATPSTQAANPVGQPAVFLLSAQQTATARLDVHSGGDESAAESQEAATPTPATTGSNRRMRHAADVQSSAPGAVETPAYALADAAAVDVVLGREASERLELPETLAMVSDNGDDGEPSLTAGLALAGLGLALSSSYGSLSENARGKKRQFWCIKQ